MPAPVSSDLLAATQRTSTLVHGHTSDLTIEQSTGKVSHRSPAPDIASNAVTRSVIHHGNHGAIDSCVICLCPITERAITSPCNHTNFDFICLASWLEQRPTCPLCKTEVIEIQYDFACPTDYRSWSVTPSAHRPAAPSHTSQPRQRREIRNFRRFSRDRHPWGEAAAVPDPDVALRARRHVYKRGLYSLHVGSNRASRYHEFTPAQFSRSGDLQSRARQWIRRELQVFTFLHTAALPQSDVSQKPVPPAGRASNAEFLLTYIVAILDTVDIRGSGGQAENMIQEFLGREDARLFLHELNSWLRSPYVRIADWDRHVQYTEKLPGAQRL